MKFERRWSRKEQAVTAGVEAHWNGWRWQDKPGIPLKGPDEDCPYGQPGDRLWVRETFSDVNTDAGPGICYKDGSIHFCQDDAFPVEYHRYPGMKFCNWYGDLMRGTEGTWRPSIHMPRWASRITIEIESVRVERVQEITQADARAEGVESEDFLNRLEHATCVAPEGAILPSPRSEFKNLWDSINARRGFGWDVNPWVWVITFRRVK